MVVPFFIFDSSGNPVSGLLPTFTMYKKRDADGNLTNPTPPAILDRYTPSDPSTAGLYEFTTAPGDAARGTVIVYIIDCTASALTRYQDGVVNGDEAVAAEESPASTLNLFDIDADAVRRHFFPQWPSFSSKSNPTAVTVAEMIDEAAADLAGRLGLRSIDATTITTTTSAAFKWCGYVLKLDVAIRIAPAVQGLDPNVVRRWKSEFKERLDSLEMHGVTVLGDGASAVETEDDPLGVTDYITENSLTTTDVDDMSSAAVPLHRDDEL